ncbi:hypothetical protein [Nonomuraea jiangxiensis]|uniref:Clp amino terminal domain-containing protein, pathogenicity island component n=1 Tax=Nonomuraea jiangxiensis TaxID=633440 RepID=A0A1G9B2M4_9ACTN|nr:hypothetical protein [Nonomuraea jiangxiensis]SDK33344.1 hypothetical protein SAMN05421869_115119 [Nonomuraea jiangxiensis]
MWRRRAALVAGALVVVGMVGPGAPVAAEQRVADDPCGRSSVVTHADKLKLAAQEGVRERERAEGGTQIEVPELARGLAAELGIGLDEATTVAKRLLSLSSGGRGLNRDSAEFRAVASGLGISVERLVEALTAIKRAAAGPAEGKSAGS